MRKIHLFIILLALYVAFYGLSTAYANASTVAAMTSMPDSQKQTTNTTNDYTTPNTPSISRAYGDPIQDPRPKIARPPAIL
jgi:hypothetical protein